MIKIINILDEGLKKAVKCMRHLPAKIHDIIGLDVKRFVIQHTILNTSHDVPNITVAVKKRNTCK